MWQHAAVALLFCALTALMVPSLVSDPFGVVIGWPGDNTFYIRQFWWMKRALVDLHTSPFFDPSTYYPAGHATANGELVPAVTLPGIPLTMMGGAVFAYNISLLVTFAMTGFGTYLWVLELTGSLPGGIVAGIVAAFLPYRFAHVLGHLPMVSTHWVPLTLLAFERFFKRRLVWPAILLGSSFALVALSSWYYAYAIGLMLPIYALVRSRPWRKNWDAAWWRGLAVAAATAAMLLLPFVVPYLRLRAGGGLTRGIGEMESWSLNFYDFLLPNRLNPAFAGFVLHWFPQQAAQWVERGVSLGYTAIALALVAWAARRRHPAMAALLAVWIASFAIALGPTFHTGDRQWLIPVPLPVTALVAKAFGSFGSMAQIKDEILARQALAIPMPAMFLFLFVPMTSGMRVMSRFGMWTGLMTAGLAGWGTALVLQRLHQRFGHRPVITVIVVAVLGGLVLSESQSRIPTMALRPRGVDVWLAQQAQPGAVAELPLESAFLPIQDYYKTIHQRPTIFGPVGDSFFPPLFEPRKAALADFPSDPSVAALRSWGVRYVLFTPSIIGGWATLKQKVDAQPGLSFDREIDGVLVYLIR
ncbi:MAG: hypothetical protein NTV05_16680 [Acidobacteria bacterium]|nr:hypothetical protein [Acidobacteriota bacterium]